MQVFNTTFKIIKQHLLQMLVYIAIFILLSVLFSVMTQKREVSSFTPVKSPVAIINHDENSDLVQGFMRYMGQKAELIPLADDEETLKDALFFRKVVDIITIPENFTRDFMAGGSPTLTEDTQPDSTHAYQTSQLVNQYFNTARLYLNGLPDISQSVLSEKTADSMDESATVTLDQVSIEDGVPGYMFYFNYLSYALLAVLILAISSIMMVFNSPDIKRRNYCSPMKLKSFNGQLAAACTVFGLVVWGAMILMAFLLYDITSENFPLILLCSLNALLMTFNALAIAFLLGQFINSYNIQNAMANAVSLGLCFLSGVFVSQDLLGGTVNAVASFTPTYWYVRGNTAIAELKSLSLGALTPVFVNMLILTGFTIALLAVALMISKYKQANQS